MSDSARKAAEEIGNDIRKNEGYICNPGAIEHFAAIIAKHFPPAPIPAMGEREAFEAWYRIPVPSESMETNSTGEYCDRYQQTAWEAWQAALSTPCPSPSEGLTEEPITTAENTPRCVCGLVLGHEGNCSGAGPVIGTFQHLMFLLCDIAHEAFHILDDADGDALRAVTMPMRVDKLDAAFTALTGSEDGDPHEIIRVIRDRLVKEGK